eukprot:s1951_g7.t1
MRNLRISALTHWGFFWANTSVIYIAEIYDNYENIADGWAGYWVKWAGLNLQWSVLSPICTFASLWLLCGKVREETRFEMSLKGLQQHGAEVAVMNGGDVRGRADYEAGPFTLGDLYKELAFAEAIAVVPMKGSVLQEAIKFSRTGTEQKPAFLHLDQDCSTDAENNILTINSQPFDPDRKYKVGIQRVLLLGMNSITPLVEFGTAVGVPDEECCALAKPAIIEVCMKDLWRKLLGFSSWDQNKDGNVEPHELKAGLMKAFKEMDMDQSGLADSAEVESFLRTRLPGNASGSLAHQLLLAADKDGNGKVQIEELAGVLH